MLGKISFFLDYIIFCSALLLTFSVMYVEKKKFNSLNKYDLSFTVLNKTGNGFEAVENVLKVNLEKLGIEKMENMEKLLLFDLWNNLKQYSHIEDIYFLKNKLGKLKIIFKLREIFAKINFEEQTYFISKDGTIFNTLPKFLIVKSNSIQWYKKIEENNFLNYKESDSVIRILDLLGKNEILNKIFWKLSVFSNGQIVCFHTTEKLHVKIGNAENIDAKLKNMEKFFLAKKMKEKEYKVYKKIDVSFRDQVICG